LDRVGDEIHTTMKLGPFFPKMKIRAQPFLGAYEDHNVLCGLTAKFAGKAQIGKGMWAQPDDMLGLWQAKIGHPKAGASCAWVPSPTGATVHALHYNQVSVDKVQQSLAFAAREELLGKILSPPLLTQQLSKDEIQVELDENCQLILGYVVRWVEMGIGCSKVPNMDNVNLMEDRATLRISSQLLHNWLLHGVIDGPQLEAALTKMAVIVDEQNAGEKGYIQIAPNYAKSLAFQAAKSLILDGGKAPSGLTEPVLHKFRREAKKRDASLQGKM
jgi:malate synthase